MSHAEIMETFGRLEREAGGWRWPTPRPWRSKRRTRWGSLTKPFAPRSSMT